MQGAALTVDVWRGVPAFDGKPGPEALVLRGLAGAVCLLARNFAAAAGECMFFAASRALTAGWRYARGASSVAVGALAAFSLLERYMCCCGNTRLRPAAWQTSFASL